MPIGIYKRTSNMLTGKYIRTEEHKNRISKWMVKNGRKGEKSNFWKGGIKNNLNKEIRQLDLYLQWRTDVFNRDKWTCKTCGRIGRTIIAHHISSFSSIINKFNIKTILEAIKCIELWDINNGITLCEECHKLTKNYAGRERGGNKLK